ncbi:universal stress protein [Pseudogemmobacter humi]|uniref:Universal stress protein n=1 Tax=Pseudogemmobacter humi TaxID=2483812 RepID=A0A3P5XJ13_9RHOB|nr:universal stress protein [Pseudogemmobacter humi]VDC30833.1 Putative universal stress protein [Pseudogemmobacter humi]
MYHHILITTDGSDLAALGLDHGLGLASKLGAKVSVLTLAEPMDPRVLQAAAVGGVHDAAARYEETIARDLAERAQAIRAKAAAAGVEIRLETGTDRAPAEAIIRFATANGCDLIVMSSHGRRGFRKLILGSQTAEVLAHSTIPVLVIRAAKA